MCQIFNISYSSTQQHQNRAVPDGRTEILGSEKFIGTKFLSQQTVGTGDPVAEQVKVTSPSFCTVFHVGLSLMRGYPAGTAATDTDLLHPIHQCSEHSLIRTHGMHLREFLNYMCGFYHGILAYVSNTNDMLSFVLVLSLHLHYETVSNYHRS